MKGYVVINQLTGIVDSLFSWGDREIDADYPINEGCYLIEIEDEVIFENAKEAFVQNEGRLQLLDKDAVAFDDMFLAVGKTTQELRKEKMAELSQRCNQTILGRFAAQVDGVTYYFSNDTEAQSNFKDAKMSFDDGTVDIYMGGSVPWTAYDENGSVFRLRLTRDQFMPVNIARMFHQQNNVSKLRDDLEPKVDAATKPSEVTNITWDSVTVNIEVGLVEEVVGV